MNTFVKKGITQLTSVIWLLITTKKTLLYCANTDRNDLSTLSSLDSHTL